MNLLDHPFTTSLAWALIHFLWQGTLIALVLALALSALKHYTATLKYALACTALILMTALPLTRLVADLRKPALVIVLDRPVLIPNDDSAFLVEPARKVTISASTHSVVTTLERAPRSPFTRLRPWILALWSLGVTLLSLRLIAGWLYTHRLKTRLIQNVSDDWNQRLRLIATQMRVC